MPANFDRCVERGGRVRRVSGPNKDHGLKEGEYVNYCYTDGKSYRGEMKKVKASEFKLSKLRPIIEVGKQFGETSEIEVLAAGNWEHPQYGKIDITSQDLDGFVKSFNDKVRKVDIAIDQEHQPEKGAAGWFKELKRGVENGVEKIKAVIEWTPVGQELIKGGIFKYFSPEFDFEYEDFETHEIFDNVLLGGALTNRPYFKSLAPVMLSENMYAGFKMAGYKCECLKCGVTLTTEKHCRDVKCPKCGGEMRRAERPGAGFTDLSKDSKGGELLMTKEELKAKLAEDSEFALEDDASDEEKASLEEAKTELEKEAKDTAGDGEEGAGEGEGEGEGAGEGEGEEEGEEGEEETVKASEILIKRQAKEMNELRSKFGVMEKKLRFKEVREDVRGYTFSESNPNGVILPKSTDSAEALIMSLSTKQTKLFNEFVESLPKISAKIFEESGSGEDDKSSTSEKLVQMATDLVKEEEGLKFGEALTRVAAANPELAKEN